MEREDIIERIDVSVWTSNIVVARKKCGGVRVCVNLSDVNKALVPQRYPLPTMEELTERLTGSTVFSKLDLAWGYLQLELAEECRYVTAFCQPRGRLPMAISPIRPSYRPVGLPASSPAYDRPITGLCSHT
jgi:hypothetical protein